jgi:glycosyltransferase involved in cell wall biosynthesis
MSQAPASPVDERVCLVGHPYAPIGMGEHVRLTFRAMRAAGMRPALGDIYGLVSREEAHVREFDPFIRNSFGALNVFHMNGDEVQQAMAHTAARQTDGAYNIIYPAWELSKYPDPWAKDLGRFDEIWAPSRFIQRSISAAVSRPVLHMPLACEVILGSFLGRRYFGIRESAYAFLFFFDVKSYASRKNPEAVIEAFREVRRARPNAEVCLVMKVNGGEDNPAAMARIRDAVADIEDSVLIIGRTMTDNEVKNLIRCADCFVSLHRSEGFGRGMAEAMYLGRPVIATGYSGNMDFCSDETAFLVRYRLVPVKDGEYPFWQGQEWAEPDTMHAAEHMIALVDRPEAGREIGRRASVHLRKGFGLRAAGNRFRRRIEEILGSPLMGVGAQSSERIA